MPRPALAFLLAAIVIALTGCISRPVRNHSPAYRRVDSTAPEYRAAVDREFEAEKAKGKTDSAADLIAEMRVYEQFTSSEKKRRTSGVAPLVAALEAFDRPRGCWAYTVTTTTSTNGKVVEEVERYDPFQPEARLWTLVSRNGRAPDEDDQRSYRREKLREWNQSQARLTEATRKRASVAAKEALNNDFKIVDTEDATRTTFQFADEKSADPKDKEPGFRRTYVVDNASGAILRHTYTVIPGSIGELATVYYDDRTTDYVILDPALPPFPSKVWRRFHRRILLSDSGEIEFTKVFSDYRRVKCYDDRFEVRVGIPSPTDR
ncbi:MAG: hypothetical protein HZA31_04460 [Opitutae bacterium]|nr:hypothetical protein [Opitutae bacterium]